MSVTINQIMPADGIDAVFNDGQREPVVCWALMFVSDDDLEIPGIWTVMGMVSVAGSAMLELVEGGLSVKDSFSHYDYVAPKQTAKAPIQIGGDWSKAQVEELTKALT